MPTDAVAVDSLVQLSFDVQLALTRVAAAHELSLTQLRMLGILRDRTPSMASIADQLELDRSSISGLVDRAERRDLVERVRSETDARVFLVRLTAAGTSLAEEVGAQIYEQVGRMLSSASRTELAAVTRLAAALPTAFDD